LATLAVRALLPLGYMPGNLLAGEFAELCPVASAATFELLSSTNTHQHHHGEPGEKLPSVGIACPIGSSLFFDALPGSDNSDGVALLRHELPRATAVRSQVSVFGRAYFARAPPLS
jgi:hypothetical protein